MQAELTAIFNEIEVAYNDNIRKICDEAIQDLNEQHDDELNLMNENLQLKLAQANAKLENMTNQYTLVEKENIEQEKKIATLTLANRHLQHKYQLMKNKCYELTDEWEQLSDANSSVEHSLTDTDQSVPLSGHGSSLASISESNVNSLDTFDYSSSLPISELTTTYDDISISTICETTDANSTVCSTVSESISISQSLIRTLRSTSIDDYFGPKERDNFVQSTPSSTLMLIDQSQTLENIDSTIVELIKR